MYKDWKVVKEKDKSHHASPEDTDRKKIFILKKKFPEFEKYLVPQALEEDSEEEAKPKDPTDPRVVLDDYFKRHLKEEKT